MRELKLIADTVWFRNVVSKFETYIRHIWYYWTHIQGSSSSCCWWFFSWNWSKTHNLSNRKRKSYIKTTSKQFEMCINFMKFLNHILDFNLSLFAIMHWKHYFWREGIDPKYPSVLGVCLCLETELAASVPCLVYYDGRYAMLSKTTHYSNALYKLSIIYKHTVNTR